MAEGSTPEELQDLIDDRLRGDRLQEVYERLARDPERARCVAHSDEDGHRFLRKLGTCSDRSSQRLGADRPGVTVPISATRY